MDKKQKNALIIIGIILLLFSLMNANNVGTQSFFGGASLGVGTLFLVIGIILLFAGLWLFGLISIAIGLTGIGTGFLLNISGLISKHFLSIIIFGGLLIYIYKKGKR